MPASRYPSPSRTDAAPSSDVMAGLLKQPRPARARQGRTFQAAEKITDPDTIATLLASCTRLTDETEDDLVFELLYLETLLMANPLKSQQLLEELEEMGDEVRDGLLPPGILNLRAIRRRTLRLKRRLGALASRVSAAMLVFFTSVPLFGQAGRAEAKEDPSAIEFQLASAPVLRVIDAQTGKAVPGVQIRTMEEHLLGTTDIDGQVVLSGAYQESDLLSLEKEGYQMYLLDRTQITGRNVISMKPATTGGRVAAKAPVAPKVVHENGSVHLEAPHAPVLPHAPAAPLPQAHKPSPAAKPAAPAAAKPAAQAHHEAPKPAAHPATAPSVHHEAAKPAAHAAAPSPRQEAPKPAAPAAAPSARHEAAMPAAPVQRMAPAHAPAVAHAAPLAAHDAPAAPQPHAAAHEPAAAHDAAPQAEAVHGAPAGAVSEAVAAHAAPPGSGAYRVQAGDTLSSIARRYLGAAHRWPEIFQANQATMKNPHVLRIGQVLQVPQAAGRATIGQRTYVVRPGDSLFRIASIQLGNGAHWRKLYQANRGRIRNPRYILPGQTLQLPR